MGGSPVGALAGAVTGATGVATGGLVTGLILGSGVPVTSSSQRLFMAGVGLHPTVQPPSWTRMEPSLDSSSRQLSQLVAPTHIGNSISHDSSQGLPPLFGALTGAVTGAVTGALTGAVTGVVIGAVTGAVIGELTGSVTGDEPQEPVTSGPGPTPPSGWHLL
mmetsp:Transcript_55193/g.66454  ORF Transcript_55193/g.66454 Transcript_55193/m.66454 type:complete len:162 (-) Transcript_55193:1592-2077(-)